MKKIKLFLFFLMFLVLSCSFPDKYKMYYSARYWIASMDLNGQDTTLIHPALSQDYYGQNEVAIPFFLNGQLKILVYANNTFYVFDENGKNSIILDKNVYINFNEFTLSKNGEYLLYQKHNFLYKAKTDGNGIMQLTGDSSYSDTQPDFSPDGKEVVFVRNKAHNNTWQALVLLSSDGETIHILKDNTNDKSSYPSFFYPKFNPDGQTIYYIYRSHKFNSGLYSLNRNGQDEKLVLKTDDNCNPVRFSTTGCFVFSCNGHLFVGENDGRQPKDLGQLFVSDYYHGQYQISADGQWIVYVPDRSHGEVNLIRADGSEMKKLREGFQPYFIPGQKRILFYAKRWYRTKKPPARISY